MVRAKKQAMIASKKLRDAEVSSKEVTVIKEGLLFKRALHSGRNWKERRIVLKRDQLEWCSPNRPCLRARGATMPGLMQVRT